ncbi:four helix bundle protein [Flavobacterium caeni]|uniref:Four helix bundle protein n=1 Tax=Flavobacterium caeni TaxID=490189 RepID=A0A1G5HK64_9FLAO|nr:four helix bundle protein [Flavobacterium caeni]SCY64094.1 four helix bundle protein [Flavobacterium caeni]
MKVQDLPAYKSAAKLAQSIFEISKQFPEEEFEIVTKPIRLSSRNVCVHLSQAMCRRKYVKYYQTTLVDADSANGQTRTWLELASTCQYIDEKTLAPMLERCTAVGTMIQHMMDHPERFK